MKARGDKEKPPCAAVFAGALAAFAAGECGDEDAGRCCRKLKSLDTACLASAAVAAAELGAQVKEDV